MDTFDFVVGAMLSQFEEDNLFHFISFCFRKFSPMEIN